MTNNEISTEPGKIYFICERALISGELSPFVKIGLTSHDRKSIDRKNDLQTGNPRELFVAHEVEVACVKAIETILRYEFLMQNIQREWHIFSAKSKDQLKDALSRCKILGESFREYTPIIQKAKVLDTYPSSGNVIQKTKESNYWHQQYLLHHEIVKLGQLAATIQREKARENFKYGKPIPHGITISERNISSINWPQFKKLYPEIIAKYTLRRFTSLFRVLNSSSGNEILKNSELNLIKTEVQKFLLLYRTEVKQTDPSLELLKQRIKIQQLTKFSLIKKELARCQLKVICETSPGIADTCTWARGFSEPRIDTARLKQENEILLQSFTTYRKLIAASLDRNARKVALSYL